MMTNKVGVPLLPRGFQDKYELLSEDEVGKFSKYSDFGKDFAHLFEDGTKVKITSEIKPPLNNTLLCRSKAKIRNSYL